MREGSLDLNTVALAHSGTKKSASQLCYTGGFRYFEMTLAGARLEQGIFPFTMWFGWTEKGMKTHNHDNLCRAYAHFMYPLGVIYTQ